MSVCCGYHKECAGCTARCVQLLKLVRLHCVSDLVTVESCLHQGYNSLCCPSLLGLGFVCAACLMLTVEWPLYRCHVVAVGYDQHPICL